MAVRLLVAAAAAMCLAGGTLTASAEPQADQGRIAFTTDRAPNLRRSAVVSVRDNGTGRRFVDIWPRGFPSFVLSPEGNRLLFLKEEGGTYGLFLAGRKGANARRLTPPEVVPSHGHGLAFSPDGTRIAFAGSCTGCRVGAKPGIFVVRTDGTRLRQVAADARYPMWSPDGRQLAYTGDMYGGPIWSVYVVGLDGKRPTRVGRGKYPVWAPGGNRVAYTTVGSDRGVLAFCVATVRRPRRHCFRGSRSSRLSWSPTGRHIALLGYGERYELALVRSDGRGLRVVARNFHSGLGWSPDGRRIAYVARRRGEYGIYLRNLARGQARLLARESPHASIGCCSFRRGRVAYSLMLQDNDHEIAVMNAEGSGFRALTNNFDDDLTPAWSPDGQTIAFSRLKIDYSLDDPTATGSALWNIRADGTVSRQLTTSGAWLDTSPSWSPDGRKIAFVRRPLNRDESVLMILDLDDGSVRPVYTPARPGGISWSPNGDWIAFTYQNALGFVHPDGTGSYSIGAESFASSPAWAPDGTRVAFVDISRDLRSVRPDGSGRTYIAGRAGPATWSPDSRRIAFGRTSSVHSSESDIWIADAAGGAEVQLTHDPSSNREPDWSP